MGEVDFSYEMAADAAGLPIAVSIFADGADVRATMQEDVEAAGFATRGCGMLNDLDEGGAAPLGELILLDCPLPNGKALAALSRLDMRVANAGSRMIVSTAIDGLDDVFGACSQSRAQILVDPLRAERVIAIGRMLAELPKFRLRELSETDRLALLRLTEQVGKIAQRLDQFDKTGWGQDKKDSAFRFNSPVDSYSGPERELIRKTKAPLPSARLVRSIISRRRARSRHLDAALFADPAWDMLLDLTAARAEHQRVSVTSLCIASGVPPTTALRWIRQMEDAALFERVEDDTDRRRAFIRLSDKGADSMACYFGELGGKAGMLI